MVKYKGISTLEVLEEAVNYNKWIAESFLPHITSPMLEIGSGIGNISSYFYSLGHVYFSDNDPSLLEILQKRFPKKKKNIFSYDVTKHIPKKYRDYFSTIIGINILEHIKDDTLTLKLLREGLKKNGRLLLLIPAKQYAYTRLDRDIGHYRRYEKGEIVSKLTEAGYTVERIYFFNILGLMSWIVRDKLSKNPYLEPEHISIFDKIVPFLRKIENMVTPPVGVSLIVIARKV